ncbi:MAG: hypothetical protein ACTSPB_26275 [Candidatus Thorarchaeota archaeon]
MAETQDDVRVEERHWREFTPDEVFTDEKGEHYVKVTETFHYPVILDVEGEGMHVSVISDSDVWIDPMNGAYQLMSLCRKGFKRDTKSRAVPVTTDFVQTQLLNWAKFWLASALRVKTIYTKMTVTKEQHEEILKRKESCLKTQDGTSSQTSKDES